jgi:hypothetical protein
MRPIQCILCFQPFLTRPARVLREQWDFDPPRFWSIGWFWVWRCPAVCEDCKAKDERPDSLRANTQIFCGGVAK